MANIFSPFGFKQYRHIEGNAPTMGFETFRIAATNTANIFTGDPVCTILAAAQASSTPFYGKYITAFGSTQNGGAGSSVVLGTSVATLGIFLGCKYYNPSVGRTVWQANYPGNQTGTNLPDVEAYVCTDPNMLYTVQASTNTLLTSTSIGAYIGFGWVSSGVGWQSSDPTGNTVTGQSGACLLSSGTVGQPAIGTFLPFQIYDFAGTYSGGAGSPSWDINPSAGALSGFVNGMDPTSAGAVMIVKPVGFTFNAGLPSSMSQ